MTKGPQKKADVRAAALSLLLEILEHGEMSHLALRRGLREYGFDQRQRAFLSRLTEGTVERCLELDYVIGLYSRTPVAKMKPAIRTLLRMSAYQLLYMDAVPAAAVCNEAVKLAARRGFAGLKGFVNAILRKIAAEKGAIPYPPEDTVQGLSVRYSMPAWLVEKWSAGYGRKTARQMLQALLSERPLMVHCNASRAAEETVRESLLSQGVEAKPHPYDAAAWSLQGPGLTRPEDLEAFRKGWIQIQDISSQLAAGLAVRALLECGGSPQVLDLCAAPGGKSVYVAGEALARGLPARILARDVSEEKVALIRQNRDRLGLTNLETEVWDALTADPSWEGRADVVMADLPCSGLGILARKRDIKYRITPVQMDELAKLQRRILSVAWRYVKPGGYLVYSTCTIHPAENEENVRWLREQFPFVPADLREWLPKGLCREPANLREGCLQLLPGIHDSDGFFLSVLRRKSEEGGPL